MTAGQSLPFSVFTEQIENGTRTIDGTEKKITDWLVPLVIAVFAVAVVTITTVFVIRAKKQTRKRSNASANVGKDG